MEASKVWGTNLRFETNSNILVSAQSGMGKSTLLHIIYGLRKDYSGKLLIDENNIRKHSYQEWENLRKQSISMVFQDLRLFQHLTARQNLQLIPEVNASSPSIEEMTAQLGVENRLDQSVFTLISWTTTANCNHSGSSKTFSPTVARRTLQPFGRRKSTVCLPD